MPSMRAEDVRQRVRATLAAAYGEGLLSDGTLAHRLDQLDSNRILEPDRLIGDLNLRDARRRPQAPAWVSAAVARLWPSLAQASVAAPAVLALDWAGTTDTLTVGRHPDCDVILDDITVSRRHALLLFRDGAWILRDLKSLNGTAVNGVSVTRCQLRPGDHLALGEHHLVVD
jgi:FHA domain-containing protein